MAAAAPDDGPVAEMESLLTCSICLETLKEPRTLGCFHSFCKCCLQKDVKRQRGMEEGKVIETFNCPMCRTEFSLKQGEKVEGMLPNHFIGNMLEVLKIQRRAKELPCFFCGSQRPAVSRCTPCEQYLCSKCLTAHNNWPGFNEHVVLTIDELAKPENQAKARGKPRCLKHEKKTLKFYCETCKELVCTHCIVLDHAKPNHSCLPIDEVAEKRRELLRASSVILDEQHKEGNEVLQKIEANTEALKNNAKKAKDDITQQKKAILKAITKKLEEKAALMIKEVDRKYNEVYEPLTQQKTDVKAYVDKVKGSMDVAKNLLEKGSHEEVIYIQKLVEENVAKVKRERPWIMKPIHNGNIQFKAKPIVPAMDDGTILNNFGEVAVRYPPNETNYPLDQIMEARNETTGDPIKLIEWIKQNNSLMERPCDISETLQERAMSNRVTTTFQHEHFDKNGQSTQEAVRYPPKETNLHAGFMEMEYPSLSSAEILHKELYGDEPVSVVQDSSQKRSAATYSYTRNPVVYSAQQEFLSLPVSTASTKDWSSNSFLESKSDLITAPDSSSEDDGLYVELHQPYNNNIGVPECTVEHLSGMANQEW